MRQTILFAAALLCLLVSQFAHADVNDRDPRLQWFREARFGMFIHWGIYSVPAGEWNGKKDYGEWIMESAKIPASQYEKFANEFNPSKFDARAWVKLAKLAGMKYIVITSKHHDGFCMFDTKQTPYNIMHTPFARDPMKELAAACKEEGITFCFYHSIMDWHSPLYEPRRAWNDTAVGQPDMDKFDAYVKAELKELLTNYGPIGILWFDGNWEPTWTKERGEDLYQYVRSISPNTIINNRVGKGVGDYGTPEQEIPATGIAGAGMPGKDWETCMTMNDHWGFCRADEHFKSTKEIIRNLVDIASKGGNYLLNVGPTSEGLIPQPSVDRLEAVGKWMSVNGESIHGTTASPFEKLPWGRCTQKPGTLFLHVFDWPADGKLAVPTNEKFSRAFLLSDSSKNLTIQTQADATAIELPKSAPDEIDSVVVLEAVGAPR